mgnify:CR=1 FL=1
MEYEEIKFEEVFKSLIEETDKILIEYDYKVGYYKEHSYAQYTIKKINGDFPYSFKRKLIQLGKKGMLLLNEKFEKIPYEHRIDYLEEIKSELSNFKDVVKKFLKMKSKDKLKISPRPFRDWGVFLTIFFIF